MAGLGGGGWGAGAGPRVAGLQRAWPEEGGRADLPVGEPAVDLGATGVAEEAGWEEFSGCCGRGGGSQAPFLVLGRPWGKASG